MSYITEAQADNSYCLWLLDEASGNAADSGLGGRGAAILGTPSYRDGGSGGGPGGDLLYALGLNSNDDLVERGAATGFSNNLTVLAWVRPDALVADQMIFDHTNVLGLGFEVALRAGRVAIRTDTILGTWRTIGDAGTVTAAAWNFIVVQRDAGTWTCTVNNVAQAATGFTDAPTAQTDLITVGRSRGNTKHLPGRVAAVEIVGTVLSPARIDARWQAAGAPGGDPEDEGTDSLAIVGSADSPDSVLDAGESTLVLEDSAAAAGVSDAGESLLVLESVAGSGVSGTTGEDVASPRLGCGVYALGIFVRGGLELVGLIPFSAIEWGRVLDDTSDAKATLNGISGAGDECCGVLAQVRPWQHELAVYRDGARIWRGPIVKSSYRGDGIVLEARDLSVWWDKRLIHGNHDFSGTPLVEPEPEVLDELGPDVFDPGGGSALTTEFVDLATMFQTYAEDAMQPDNSPGLCVTASPTGILAERNVLAAQHLVAGPLLRELSRAGVDWTVVDDDVLVGGSIVPTVRLPVLTDDHFAEEPLIILDGLIQENRAGVRGAGVGEAGDALWADARDGDSITRYGLLEGATTEAGLTDLSSVRHAARSRLDALSVPPGTIQEGVLSPEVGIPLGALVPGAPAQVRLGRTCLSVSGDYRLAFVKGTVTASEAGTDEKIVLGFIPPGSGDDVRGENYLDPVETVPPDPPDPTSICGGPIVWYHLGELSGEMLDSSGFGRHATLVLGTQPEATVQRGANPLAEPEDGAVDMHARFVYPWVQSYPDVASGPHIVVPTSFQGGWQPWADGSPFTMLFWVMAEANEPNFDLPLIGGRYYAGNAYGFGLYIGADRKLKLQPYGGTLISSAQTFPIASPRAVAITYAGGILISKVYVEAADHSGMELWASGTGGELATGTTGRGLYLNADDLNLAFSGGFIYGRAVWDEFIAWDCVVTEADLDELVVASWYWKNIDPEV